MSQQSAANTGRIPFREGVIQLPPHTHFAISSFVELLESTSRTLKHVPYVLLINLINKTLWYSFVIDEEHYPVLESQFYTSYQTIEITERTTEKSSKYRPAARAQFRLRYGDYYPFLMHTEREGSMIVELFHEISQLDATDAFFIRLVVLPTDRNNAIFTLRRSLGLTMRGFRDNIDVRQRLFSKKGSNTTRAKAMVAGAAKNKEPLFQTDLSMFLLSNSASAAQAKLERIASLFQKLESDYNDFQVKVDQIQFAERDLFRVAPPLNGYVFTATELGTIFHLPPETDSVPNLVKILSPKAEPPSGLPTPHNTSKDELCPFAITNYRQTREEFGIKRRDRARHMYVLGKSGSGKSRMLELLIKSDLEQGQGLCVIDPHGDMIDAVLKMVPESRVGDVIYFNPTDEDFPISFNPIEKVAPLFRPQVTSGLIEIFKKVFADQWTPRLEHVMRMSILALLDAPKASILSILLLLTDRSYRQQVVQTINDDVVKNFWTNEFAGWSEKFDAEAITPILNKIGQFVSNPIIRNIVSQEENKVVLPEIMNNRKILLVKLPKGILGEENTSLLGSMIITRIYQAALSRAEIAESDRVPFYMYVDEFQNFATDSFANILSESRKYKLIVTLANQYVSQLSEVVRKTVFGNVGTLVSFRIGPEDAQFLETEFAPRFKAADLTNLAVREMYMKLSIDEQVRESFSARTLDSSYPETNFREAIIANTRANYCTARKVAEQEIASVKSKELEVIERLKKADFSAPIV